MTLGKDQQQLHINDFFKKKKKENPIEVSYWLILFLRAKG